MQRESPQALNHSPARLWHPLHSLTNRSKRHQPVLERVRELVLLRVRELVLELVLLRGRGRVRVRTQAQAQAQG